MRRIESTQVPAETRKMLRDRLARFLPTDSTLKFGLDSVIHPRVSDKELVDLLLNLEFLSGNDICRSQVLYEEGAQRQALDWPAGQAEPKTSLPVRDTVEYDTQQGEGNATSSETSLELGNVSIQISSEPPSFQGLFPPPSFNDLLSEGWIRQSWGQIYVPDEIRRACRDDANMAGTAFHLLVQAQYENEIKLREGFCPKDELESIANEIINEQRVSDAITCISRPWVAARLWDMPDKESTDSELGNSQERLGHWIDRLQLLNAPAFQMSSYVDRDSFGEFAEAGLAVLSAVTTTPSWTQFAEATVAPIVLLNPQREQERVVPSLPATTVERIDWISRGLAERTFYEYLIYSRTCTLLNVLLNEIEAAAFDPKKLASRLMECIVDRPVLLGQLVLSAGRAPVLLADMLMFAPTCPLACSLIARWEINSGGWNRDFQAHANHTTVMLAFEDAVAILGAHLDANHVSAAELAALYRNIYELTLQNPKRPIRMEMLALLRQELTSAAASIPLAVFDSLVASAASDTYKMSGFCAALDFISDAGLAERVDPTKIVALYLDMLLQNDCRGIDQLSVAGAQAFVSLALKCPEDLRNRFLAAVDVQTWLQSAPASQDEKRSYHFQLAERIRVHIRLLCRAIVGWPCEIPGELVNGLAKSIHAGATDQPKRGRIDAFVPGPGFGFAWAEEEPIALDLARALRKLQGNSRQHLVTEVCQIDEPLVLAGIISNTPVATHEQIKKHLQRLTPDTAPEVWSLPAMQARIDALLNAGLPDVAQVFISDEHQAKTLGPVPGREVTTLRASLRLLLLRQDWSALATYSLPSTLDVASRREAQDVLLFFQGVAELKKPGGNPAVAEAIFSGLSKRNQNITSYSVNLFACQVTRLLGGDSFGLLSGETLAQAKRYLADAEQTIRPLVQHSPADLKALEVNRALLLLAVDQPRESLHVLMDMAEAHHEATIEGFRALALARLGYREEAIVALDKLEKAFGRSDLTSAIRENVDTHRPFATAPHILLDNDRVPGISHAFAEFSRLGALEQAQVLHPSGGVEGYLLEEVRGACASVVELAPTIRNLGMIREDDISGVLKQILQSRLIITQWAVADQSRGGFSQTGNPGERDLVINKGSATLAVIEALITDSVKKKNLTSHFNKLLGYSTCPLFFHITYAKKSNCAAILDYLQTTCKSPPQRFKYLKTETLDDIDSSPLGFKAYFDIGSRRVVAVFLVLEIGQPIQRAAAANAKARP